MARIELSEADLLADLTEAMGDAKTEDGLTTRELRGITGWGEEKTYRIVEKLIVGGKWEAVKLQRTSRLDGVTRQVIGFRPVRSD